ncbi:MAG: thiamine/thiamine pyrophosphate ABC transporter permease ThiP, partial [Candidatus Competibacteraceae bacterium]|nr:thiamine/thiamine pyrophosphate ABC transporter permease ThiP [Candidatus Competibacteraceae bacterium]
SGRSLWVALSASSLAVALAWALALSGCELRLRRHRPRWADLLEFSGSLALAVPALVLGTGLFILLQPHIDVLAAGLWLVVLVQALLALPFALRLLAPPLLQSAQRYDRLCASLDIRGWQRWRWVEWPQLRRALGLALALGAALAIGDLGAIA